MTLSHVFLCSFLTVFLLYGTLIVNALSVLIVVIIMAYCELVIPVLFDQLQVKKVELCFLGAWVLENKKNENKLLCLFVLALSFHVWFFNLQVHFTRIVFFFSISRIIFTYFKPLLYTNMSGWGTSCPFTPSGISRVIEYSVRNSRNYSSSKNLNLHSPSYELQ